MAENNAPNGPGFIEANSHNAQVIRQLAQNIFQNPGIIDVGDLQVTQNGTPNMSVNVAAGYCVIPGSFSFPSWGSYAPNYNDASVNKAIAAAPTTGGKSRIDIVVAQINDAQASGSANNWAITVVTGSAAVTPVQPATPSNALLLAVVTVGNAVNSIVTANIANVVGTAQLMNTPATAASRTHRAAAQSIPNNTATVVAMDTEDYDPLNMFVAGVWTCPFSGVWAIRGGFSFGAAPAAGAVLAYLGKNGTTIWSKLMHGGTLSGQAWGGSGGSDGHFVAGDTVSVYVTQVTASAWSTATDGANFLSASLISQD